MALMKKPILIHALWAAVAVLAFMFGRTDSSSLPRGAEPALPSASANVAAEPAERSAAADGPRAGAAPDGSAATDELRARLFAALEEPNSLTRLRRVMDFFATLDAATWETAYAGMIIETIQTGRTHDLEWRLMLQRSGEVGGARAMERFFKEGNRFASSLVLTGWGAADPVAARAWVEALPAGAARQAFIGDLVDGMVQRDPALASALLASLPPEERAAYGGKLIRGTIQHGGYAVATAVLDEVRRAEAGRDADSETSSQAMFATLADCILSSNWKAKTPQAACLWIGQHAAPGDLQPDLLTHAAGDWARLEPVHALDWVQSLGTRLDGETAQRGVGGVVEQWVKKDASAAGLWLNANPDHPLHDRVAYAYAERLVKLDPSAAASWVETIQDPDLRARAQQRSK